MDTYKTRERFDLKRVFTWDSKLSETEIKNLFAYLRKNHDVYWMNGSTTVSTTNNTIEISDDNHSIKIELVGNDNSMSASLNIDGYYIFNFLVFKKDNSYEIFLPFTKSTMFGLWTRRYDDEIGSRLGYGSTNLDYIWSKMKSWRPMILENYMIIEEKIGVTFVNKDDWPTGYQEYMFKHLHNNNIKDPLYRGIHIIQFSKTNPDDGNTYIDGGLVHKSTLFKFLRFELPPIQYRNYFEKKFSKDRQSITDCDLRNPYDMLI